MDALLIWGKFLGVLGLIYYFGTRAAESADIIAEKKGLAKAFMGVVFISMVTSFPELFTGISAVTLVEAPDMAMGEIIGSCLFNLLIIAVIDLIYRKNNFFKLEGKLNYLPLAFGFILVNILTLAIALKSNLAVFHVSVFSILIFGLYIFFMYVIFKERKVDNTNETTVTVPMAEEEEKKAAAAAKAQAEYYNKRSLKKEMVIFIVSSLVIIGVGIYLPIIGEELTHLMGWNQSFVGIIFLAFVTSFPELVVSFSTARMGAYDMLLGNIAGSNLFNIAILFFIDLFYLKHHIFSQVNTGTNVAVGLITMLMNFILFFAVIRRSEHKLFGLVSVNSLCLIILYLVNLFVIY